MKYQESKSAKKIAIDASLARNIYLIPGLKISNIKWKFHHILQYSIMKQANWKTRLILYLWLLSLENTGKYVYSPSLLKYLLKPAAVLTFFNTLAYQPAV